MNNACPALKSAQSLPAALALLSALCSSAIQSAEYSRNVMISRVAAVSISRPAYPGAQNVFRVYTNTIQSWGSSDCRADAADLSIDDWHMYPIVLRAWKESLQLTVVVESASRIDTTDTVCRIVAVNVT